MAKQSLATICFNYQIIPRSKTWIKSIVKMKEFYKDNQEVPR